MVRCAIIEVFFSVAELSVKIEAVKKNNSTGRNEKKVKKYTLRYLLFSIVRSHPCRQGCFLKCVQSWCWQSSQCTSVTVHFMELRELFRTGISGPILLLCFKSKVSLVRGILLILRTDWLHLSIVWFRSQFHHFLVFQKEKPWQEVACPVVSTLKNLISFDLHFQDMHNKVFLNWLISQRKKKLGHLKNAHFERYLTLSKDLGIPLLESPHAKWNKYKFRKFKIGVEVKEKKRFRRWGNLKYCKTVLGSIYYLANHCQAS